VPHLLGGEQFLHSVCLGASCYSCEEGCQSSWEGALERSQMGRHPYSSYLFRLVAGFGGGGVHGSSVGLGNQISHIQPESAGQ
jgi:hypothetical protein